MQPPNTNIGLSRLYMQPPNTNILLSRLYIQPPNTNIGLSRLYIRPPYKKHQHRAVQTVHTATKHQHITVQTVHATTKQQLTHFVNILYMSSHNNDHVKHFNLLLLLSCKFNNFNDFVTSGSSSLRLPEGADALKHVGVYVNNCPTTCNYIQFIYICKLLYMFRVVSPHNIRSSYCCIHSIWH
jgi:hypothetical protein